MSAPKSSQPVLVTNPAAGFTFSARDTNGVIRSLAGGDVVYDGETVKITGDYTPIVELCTLSGKINGAWHASTMPAPGNPYSSASYWGIGASGPDDANYDAACAMISGSW